MESEVELLNSKGIQGEIVYIEKLSIVFIYIKKEDIIDNYVCHKKYVY